MNGRRVGTLAALFGMAMMSSGCATILSGTKQTVTVRSNPPGAHVSIGTQNGTTPTAFTLSKGKNCTVQVAHAPGKRVVHLKRHFDPVTLLNIIPPFWPGFIVDAVTGAMMKYEPEVVMVDFRTAATGTDAQLTGMNP